MSRATSIVISQLSAQSERGVGSLSSLSSMDEHPWETIIWGPFSKPLDVIEPGFGKSRLTVLGQPHGGNPHRSQDFWERVPCPNNPKFFPRRISRSPKRSEVLTLGVILWLLRCRCVLIRSLFRWVTLKRINWEDDNGVQVRRN